MQNFQYTFETRKRSFISAFSIHMAVPLLRLKNFINFEEKKILINSYVVASLNYSPLVWMLPSASSLKKIVSLQKRALRFLCNDYEISYEEILSKSTSSMNVKRLRAFCIELYKTINKLNPNFRRDLFRLLLTNRPVHEKYRMNMIIPEFNQISYGKKSLRIFDLKLWNSLPYHIKSSENLESFKRTIKLTEWDSNLRALSLLTNIQLNWPND